VERGGAERGAATTVKLVAAEPSVDELVGRASWLNAEVRAEMADREREIRQLQQVNDVFNKQWGNRKRILQKKVTLKGVLCAKVEKFRVSCTQNDETLSRNSLRCEREIRQL